MSTITPSTVEDEVTCHGLLLALVATQLRTAWHAGVVDGESAMRCLDTIIQTLLRSSHFRPLAQRDAVAVPPLEDGHASVKGGR